MAVPEVEETSRCRRDRISELPAAIRQHILSFLHTKQAVSTSVLSTTWRYDWLVIPCIDFSSQSFNFDKLNPSQYLQILDHVLQLRKLHRQNGIRKFSLYLPYLSGKVGDVAMGWALVDQWLDFVAEEGKLEDLTCHVKDNPFEHTIFSRTSGILASLNNSITKLDLEGCHIYDDKIPLELVTFNLPFLRELSLSRVRIGSNRVLEILLAHCKSLEKVRLHDLCEMRQLKLIRNSELPKLKDVEVVDNSGLERVEIDVSNLHRLLVCAYWDTPLSTIQVTPSCRELVDLQLSNCRIKDDVLNPLLDQLVHLEYLKLEQCHRLKSIIIVSNCLVNLTIMQCRSLGQLELDIPPCGLRSFIYHIEVTIMSIQSTTPLASMYAEVRLAYVQPRHADCCRIETEDELWHTKVVALLGKLSYSKHVSLFMNSPENAIIPQRLRQSACLDPLHGNQHFGLSLAYVQTSHDLDLIQCLDSLLWLSPHPKYIHISGEETSSLNILLELIYKEESENKKSCICYPSQPINCWRHSLKNFEIRKLQGFKEDGSLTRFFEEAVKGARD